MGLFNSSKSKDKPPRTDADWDAYLSQLEPDSAAAAGNLFDDMNLTLDGTINTLEETKGIGNKTLEELEDQGDRLKKVDHDIQDIRQANHENKKLIRGLHFFGRVFNKVFACCIKPPTEQEWSSIEETRRKHKHKKDRHKKDSHHGGSIGTGTTPLYDKYKQTEQGLDKVDALTTDLNGIALKMRDEIENQIDNLDRILDNADKAIEEMQANTSKANNALT